jgi:outer membrane receptor protein involved in Fe transport
LRREYTFLPGPFASDFEVQRVAGYGELSRPLSAGFELTLGVRYEMHEADYRDNEGVRFDPSDNLFGGRVLLEKTLTDNQMLYAGITQGYKAGGFNQDGSLAADLRQFDPETLWNVEFGYKARFAEDRLSLRTTLFRMQRRDIQISTSTTRPIPGSPGAVEFIEYTGNAAEGVNQGLELEVDFAVNQNWSLFASVGLLDTELEDYVDNSGRDLDGRDQAHAPNYQFFAGSEYALGAGWSVRLEVEGKDAYYFSDSHSQRSEAYELIHASVEYAAEHWRVRLWGRNLADEDYPVRGFFFGNDPRDFYTARTFTQLGEPRQVGISIEANF